MPPPFCRPAIACLMLISAALPGIQPRGALAEVDVKYIEPSSDSGQSGAVVVGPAHLVHTEQVHSRAAGSAVLGDTVLGDTVAEQVGGALGALAAALPTGSGMDRVVKLNAYVADAEVAVAVRRALAERFDGDAKPAVSYVTTRLPQPGAVVAFDAVAITDRATDGRVQRWDDRLEPELAGHAYAAASPPGGRVYIAGQAEPGDLAEATRKTLASLRRTLQFLKLDLDDAVQLKSFLTPIDQADVVRREMKAFFGDSAVPPLVFVEWQSTLPIEIELIAAAPAAEPTVQYLTPPGMDASPVFSRVAVANGPRTIYVSGLHGAEGDSAEAQTRGIFADLKRLLAAAGGDLRHLAKATYYVADEDASGMLNKLRPEYYDPARPPAASKAMVRGVGLPGRTITLDMIAVPTAP